MKISTKKIWTHLIDCLSQPDRVAWKVLLTNANHSSIVLAQSLQTCLPQLFSFQSWSAVSLSAARLGLEVPECGTWALTKRGITTGKARAVVDFAPGIDFCDHDWRKISVLPNLMRKHFSNWNLLRIDLAAPNKMKIINEIWLKNLLATKSSWQLEKIRFWK